MPSAEDTDRFNAAYRQVIRRRTRGTLGSVVSSLLTPALPYMAIPAGVGLYAVDRSDDARAALRDLEAQGFKPRKRDWLGATLQATAEKAVLTPLTLGHDEVLLAGYGGMVDYTAHDVARADYTITHTPGWDVINATANAPINAAQGVAEVQGGEARLEHVRDTGVDTGGWNEETGTVVKNVVGVGAVAGAVEYAVDRPFGARDERAEQQRELEEEVEARDREKKVSEAEKAEEKKEGKMPGQWVD